MHSAEGDERVDVTCTVGWMRVLLSAVGVVLRDWSGVSLHFIECAHACACVCVCVCVWQLHLDEANYIHYVLLLKNAISEPLCVTPMTPNTWRSCSAFLHSFRKCKAYILYPYL